jgi:YVTN family beta-propeller protein
VPVPPYVSARITVGGSPSGIAIDPTGIWVSNWWDNTLSVIDPSTNTVISTRSLDISGNAGPEAVASGLGSIWVTVSAFDDQGEGTLAGSLKRIDPVTGQTLATIPVGKGPFSLSIGAGSVWVPLSDDNTVIRIDPSVNQIVATIPVAGSPLGATFGLGALWVSGTDGTVTRIDPTSNSVIASIHTQSTGGYVTTGGGAVWVTNPGNLQGTDGVLSRIDPATNQVVTSIPVGSYPQSVTFGGGSVWVGMDGEPSVVRVGAATNAVTGRIGVSGKVYAITASDTSVWAVHNLGVPSGASSPPSGSVTRINYGGPTTSGAATPPPSPSPTPAASPTPGTGHGGTLYVGPRFSLGFPAGWSQDLAASDATTGVIVFRGPDGRIVEAQSVPTLGTLDEIATAIRSNIKSQMGVDPEQDEALTMDGVPGHLLTFHVTASGVSLYSLDAVCVNNGRAYEIAFVGAAGNEGSDRATFTGILGSFAFGPGH